MSGAGYMSVDNIPTGMRRQRLGQFATDPTGGFLTNWLSSQPSVQTALSLPSPIAPDVADVCSTWDFYFNPQKWQACAASVIASGPQSVVENAKAAGYPQSVIDAAQAAADQQAAQAGPAAANVASYYGAGNVVYTPGSPNSPLGLPMWFWLALLGGGALVLAKVL
jgi:hypothetical protein